MTSDPVRTIVVGAGKMGLLHGGLLTASGAGKVVGMVDPSRAARFTLAGMGLRVPRYASLADALAKAKRPEAVFVCAPPGAHASLATEALEAGVALFVEKPLTTRADASARIADLARVRGLRGHVGYVRRHHVVYARLREKMGRRPQRLSVRVRSPQFAGPEAPSGLHRGGIAWDLLPHAADMAAWLLGAPLLSAPTAASLTGRGRVVASTRAGSTAIDLEADWASTEVRKVEMAVAATFDDGSRLECDEDALWAVAPGGARSLAFHRRDAPPPWFDLAGHEFSAQALDVTGSFRGAKATSATLAEAAAVDAFIESCLQAAGEAR
jgi:predicted dehydrogenase